MMVYVTANHFQSTGLINCVVDSYCSAAECLDRAAVLVALGYDHVTIRITEPGCVTLWTWTRNNA